jgi:uncharacterized protein YraI
MSVTAQFRSARLLFVLITLALAIVSGLTIAAAQENATTIKSAEGVPAVNVRSGPGTDYTVRFALNAGQTLVATGRTEATACTGNTQTDGWLRIAVSETIEGWVNVCAITISGDVNALPVAEPTYPEKIEDAEPLAVLEGGTNFTNPDMIAETTAPVVMRTEPWLGAEELGIVPADASVELVQMTTNMGWIQAKFGDVTGWVPGLGIEASEGQQAALPVVPISQVAKVPNTANSGSSVFCLWFPGLRQQIDPFTGVVVGTYVPNQWSLCY